jgi:DNA-binding transcriptional regulator YhcF (GntR family)
VGRNVDIQVEEDARPSAHNAEAWLAERLILDFCVGRISAGDRMPSVRALAGTLRVSTNTVLRLYQRLEARGFLEIRDRSGTFVRPIGVHLDRNEQQATIYKLLQFVIKRLRLYGLSPGNFSALLLQRCGAASRPHFQFGVVSIAELFETISRQLETALGFRLPLLRIPPHVNVGIRSGAARLLRDSSTRHLLTTYLYWPDACDLAQDFGIPTLALRLNPQFLQALLPDRNGRRYVVTRDAEFAADARRIAKAVHGQHAADALTVVDVNNHHGLASLGQSASEILASPMCLERVTAMFGRTHQVHRLPLELSEQAINEIVFRYLFARLDDVSADECRRFGEMG